MVHVCQDMNKLVEWEAGQPLGKMASLPLHAGCRVPIWPSNSAPRCLPTSDENVYPCECSHCSQQPNTGNNPSAHPRMGGYAKWGPSTLLDRGGG